MRAEPRLSDVPARLAALHNRLADDAAIDLNIDGAGPHDVDRCADMLAGAGFDAACTVVEGSAVDGSVVDGSVRAEGRRVATLPDYVGPAMHLLICGLNPSLHAVRDQVGFSGPGNRFWPAMRAAGLSNHPGDAARTLAHDRIGMTDLVKRATPRAAALTRAEYRDGAERVERLVEWLAPSVVCFVGLSGWRIARDSAAQAGLQAEPFGGRPAYVMPSTSGLNTHVRLDDLVDHVRAAAAVAG